MSYTRQKIHNKFYDDISISEGLSSKEMTNFWGIDKYQDVAESIHKKLISSKTEYGSFEDPSNMDRTGSNETALASETSSINDNKNVIIAPGQLKKPVSVLSDEFCEEQAFHYLFPKGKLGCKAHRDIQ